MQVGELFVSLGIKGADKTKDALNSAKNSLVGLKDASFEAKAAVIGAMYALERMFAASGAIGTGLMNFTALTGEAADTLQRYQYAARQAGVSNQEMEASFKTIQSVMARALYTGDHPIGLYQVGLKTGHLIGQSEEKRYMEHPEEFIQLAQQYAQNQGVPAAMRNEMLKSLGLSEGVIAAAARNKFSPENLAAAPTYTDRQKTNLDRANIGWINLGQKIEKAFGNFNAAHGEMIVSSISKIVSKLIDLANALQKLAEVTHLFPFIEKLVDLLANTTKTMANVVGDVGGGISSNKPATTILKNVIQDDIAGMKNFWGIIGVKELSAQSMLHNSHSIAQELSRRVGSEKNNNINQTLNFNGDNGHDPKKTSNLWGRELKNTLRQIPQGQGS